MPTHTGKIQKKPRYTENNNIHKYLKEHRISNRKNLRKTIKNVWYITKKKTQNRLLRFSLSPLTFFVLSCCLSDTCTSNLIKKQTQPYCRVIIAHPLKNCNMYNLLAVLNPNRKQKITLHEKNNRKFNHTGILWLAVNFSCITCQLATQQSIHPIDNKAVRFDYKPFVVSIRLYETQQSVAYFLGQARGIFWMNFQKISLICNSLKIK